MGEDVRQNLDSDLGGSTSDLSASGSQLTPNGNTDLNGRVGLERPPASSRIKRNGGCHRKTGCHVAVITLEELDDVL
jgi:hypothetical protein